MIDMDFKRSLQKVGPIDRKLHELIPQEGVQLSLFPPECRHNAIWDYAISPQGRHYFSLCAENTYSAYAQLYEYLPESGRFELCFKVEDSIVTYDRNVRASKIHTSISFMPDGRLIMTTHTTAAAPGHPHWLFMHYLNHPWEGYSGSNVLIYDPASKKVEDLGIPVQRDSIYGACYDPARNALYFSTYLRGHTFRLDLENRNLTDYGQMTGQGSFFLKMGRDGNIYTTTRNGCLLRINTRSQRIEDVGFQFYPNSMMMSHAIDGPDGRLYMFAQDCTNVFAYDYETQKVDRHYRIIPEEFDGDGWNYFHGGGGFDERGVLWYALLRRIGDENQYQMTYLCALDIAQKDPKAVNTGLLGTRDHSIRACCEAFVQNDTFYAVSSNHANEPPGIFRAGLEPVRRGLDKPRQICNDPYAYVAVAGGEKMYEGDLYADGEIYYQFIKEVLEYNRFIEENRPSFATPRREVSPIWMELGRGSSSVVNVGFDRDGNILAVCGRPGGYTRLTIRGGDIVGREDGFDYAEPDLEQIAQKFAHLQLPKQAGRGFKARASAYCSLAGGKYLVGTLDGMLAVVDGDSVFALGAVTAGEPVRSLASNSAGTLAYGVASDPQGFGMVFSYDVNKGVALHGFLLVYDDKKRAGYSYEPRTVAFAPDDRSIAIGAGDNMGTVYRFFLEE
ncbi:MAG: hypothetical protein FWF44_02135 [Defluviitaleaceae bacterium]|nr:hypothetical protein [Defluviitaleaceae bacterium]